MAEYIDKEAARLAVIRAGYLENILPTLDAVPAADVVPVVHGKWKYYHKQGKAVCTNCSFERSLDDNFGTAVACPNCAALMYGGKNDAAD